MALKKRFCTRAQITPFIIIGIVVLLLLSATSYVIYISAKQPLELKKGELGRPDIESAFSSYVRNCIAQESEEPVLDIGMHGGTLYPMESSSMYYNRTRVSYLCYTEGFEIDYACVNSMLTRSAMEYELSREIKTRLEGCIDMSPFSRFADEIKTGNMEVDVEIAKDDVVVNLNYPVRFVQGESTTSVKEFSSTMDYPLGRLYYLAESIVNSEITHGSFNKDKWMAENGADVLIQKRRPYPDTVYTLEKNGYKFQFARQSFPTAGSFVGEKKHYYGCCMDRESGMCFKNTDPLRCIELQGEYNPNIECSCSYSYEPKDPCSGEGCLDCPEAGREHGESWCSYDTITGEGMDYVGSRHYKLSCINGTIYTEGCRDYREELCTERTENRTSEAVCRENRWHTCFECDTKTCCEDERHRDCYWDSSLETEGKCIPEVPPGLRFWENEGADICLRGNQEKECNGLSCPQPWLDSAAEYCYSQGDCGNYRNINDQLSEGGFYETDMLKKVNESAYPPGGLNRNPLPNGTGWKLTLGFQKAMSDVLSSPKSSAGTMPLFISSLSNFFSQLSGLNPSSYSNPFLSHRIPKIRDFSICRLWVPPEKGDCSKCSEDPSRPCSEYRCRSISSECIFEMKEGVPVCRRASIVDFSRPVVEIDKDAIPPEYSLESSTLGSYHGYRIIEPVKPHKPFTFGVKASEEVRCTVSLSPRIEDYSLQTVMLGDSVFREKHNMTIRIPPKLEVPEKIMDAVNLSSSGGVLELFYNARQAMDSLMKNLGPGIEAYNKLTGADITEQLMPKVNSISEMLDRAAYNVDLVVRALLKQFDKGGYYLFFDCTDRAGNRNKNQIFLKFTVDYGYEDSEPPRFIQTVPANNSRISPSLERIESRLYLDEPAECRFSYLDTDYEHMNNSLSCPAGSYQLSPAAGGTYECRGEFEVPYSKNRIFIRCADHPPQTEEFSLEIMESNTSSASLKPESEINSEANETNASLSDYVIINSSSVGIQEGMLDIIRLDINTSEVELSIYTDDRKEFRHSLDDISFEKMQRLGACKPSDRKELGIYKCTGLLKPPTQFDRRIGNYTLRIIRGEENKLVDGNPERAKAGNRSVNITFEEALSGADTVELNMSGVDIRIYTRADAECSMNINSSRNNTPLQCASGDEYTLCGKHVELAGRETNISISCSNSSERNITGRTHHYIIKAREENTSARNINKKSFEYVLNKAEELKIINISPSGVISSEDAVLSLKITEDIVKNEVQCGYNDNPYSYLTMSKTGYRSFKADLPELDEGKEYTYYVKCTDKHGSEATGKAEFRFLK